MEVSVNNISDINIFLLSFLIMDKLSMQLVMLGINYLQYNSTRIWDIDT